MKVVFADTFYFIALVNRDDAAHDWVVSFSRSYSGRLTTTGFVLLEFADGLASNPQSRKLVSAVVDNLLNNPNVSVHSCSHELFQAGWSLYLNRQDKQWSLTDCISFVTMQRDGITDALTGDHHFEQAGFQALIK